MRPWFLLTISNFSTQGPTDNSILMSLLLATETKINLNEHYVILGVEIKENVLARHKFTNLLKSVSP